MKKKIDKLFVDEIMKIKYDMVFNEDYIGGGLTDDEIKVIEINVVSLKDKIENYEKIEFNYLSDYVNNFEKFLIKFYKKYFFDRRMKNYKDELSSLETLLSDNILYFFTNKENEKYIRYDLINKKYHTIIDERLDDVYYTTTTNMVVATDIDENEFDDNDIVIGI